MARDWDLHPPETTEELFQEGFDAGRQAARDEAERNPIVILVIRDPDSANTYTVDGPEPRIITVDLGNAFDGRPRNRDEAETAREYIDTYQDELKTLDPNGKVARALSYIIDTLTDDADEILGPEDAEA